MYYYAGNTPVKYTDPDGRDIILLNRSWGAMGAGHNACIIGDDTNGWVYFSKEGLHENANTKFQTLQDFIDYNNSMDLDSKLSYDWAYRVETPHETDEKAQALGEEIYNRGYSLCETTDKNGKIKQNCADLAGDIIGEGSDLIIKKGQVKVVKPFTVPNSQFKSFIEDNKGSFIDIYDKDKAEIRRRKDHPLHWEEDFPLPAQND